MALNIDLQGKVAIVTGGGRGIGRSIAIALAEAGADVAVVARTKAELDETAHLISTRGRKALPIPADVTDGKNIEDFVQQVLKVLGGIHLLVNGAGILKSGPLLEYPEELWDRVISVNLKSVFLCTKIAGRHMVEQRYGKIINLASTGGEMASPGNAAYHASKAAVVLFTKSVGLEWIRYNINVNAIGPGFVKTEIMKEYLRCFDEKTIMKAIPIRRYATPDEIAPLAVFLASDLSSYMVGEHVIIDGGLIST